MNELVFLKPSSIKSIPFTTSDVIAEYAKIANRSVYLLIEKHIKHLEKFGRVSFEMRPSQTKGGMQEVKIYHLNEEQATLLITFLKNTEPVIQFKTELVRQFYAMRSELQHRQIGREQLRPIRRELTDVISDNPDHNRWDYKLYTDLAYKFVTGRNAAQIRKGRGASKTATAIDYMTADEIGRIAKLQNQISVLCEMGLDYYQIKAMLLNRQMVGKIA
jgi:phage regulator Rha-like protein